MHPVENTLQRVCDCLHTHINAIASKMDIVDVWKIGKRRRGVRHTP